MATFWIPAICDSLSTQARHITTFTGSLFEPKLIGFFKLIFGNLNEEEIFKKSLDVSEIDKDYLNNKKLKILTIGRFVSQKGYDLAIQTANILKEEKIDFTWYAIGEGIEKQNIIDLIKKYNLKNNFVLLGRKENPYPYIKNCDFYIQPSRHEAYCTTTLEAKLLKKLIICTNVAGASDQFDDYNNGLIVNEFTPEAIAEKIIELINNKELQYTILENLNKSGLGISKTTLLRYIKCLIDAKILYECDRFDMKSKRSLLGEKKYYIADLSFSYISNPDSRINYGPVLENIIYTYARSKSYTVTVGRIGKLECDFVLKDKELNYSYVQVAYTILESKKTEDREYNSLEMIRDNYPKYVVTTDYLLQKRNGIKHINLMQYLKNGGLF